MWRNVVAAIAVFLLIVFWGLLIMISNGRAGDVGSFYGPTGAYEGSYYRNGNSTSYYDGAGAYRGSSYDVGRTRSFYGGDGSYQGYTYRERRDVSPLPLNPYRRD